MEIKINTIKGLFAAILLSVSLNASSAIIFEMQGDVTGIFPNLINTHTIDTNSVTMNSDYGFSLDSFNTSILGLAYYGFNSFLNGNTLGLFETNVGFETIVDDGISHLLSFNKDAYIIDVNFDIVYSGTMFVESEWFYPDNQSSGYGNFKLWFDAPSVTASAVPEPSMIALLSLGLAGLGFARKKKYILLK